MKKKCRGCRGIRHQKLILSESMPTMVNHRRPCAEEKPRQLTAQLAKTGA
ncbi:Hypothetical protein ABZS17D1_01552 [Kosakonia cowanii]